MQANINPPGNKSKLKSTGLALATLLGLLLVIAVLWGKLSGSKKTALSELADKLAEEKIALRQNLRLHERFGALQKLDESYGSYVMNSAPQSSIDSMALLIQKSEDSFRKTIDSVSKEGARFNAWSNVVMLDSVTATFRIALANRRVMSAVRSAIAGKATGINPDKKKIIIWQNELQRKEEQIIALENQMKTMIERKTPTVRPTETVKKEIEELKQELNEEEIRTTQLLDINNSLKQDIGKLNLQLSQAKRSTAYDEANFKTIKSKNQTLEQEVEDLNAELNFARIDCNLARADAKKIISNSKQRKELLSEALQTLEGLAQSDNSIVKKKVKEKVSELNQIASTVRD